MDERPRASTEQREQSWREEDSSEESTSHGTREDIGLSGENRDDAPPRPGFRNDVTHAGSLSDAAMRTEVEGEPAADG